MAVYLITGATSGLGQQAAMRLARLGGHHLVLPARDISKFKKLREELLHLGAALVSVPQLDLSSLKNVAAFIESFQRETSFLLDGMLLNAGRQSAGKLSKTIDGFESTFAVNHLAHYLLYRGLENRLANDATVGWTASGTHDPEERSARMSGFRGAQYTTARRLADGDYADASGDQACKDAYATSKLCAIVMASSLANDPMTNRVQFSFDPGLMPGTGLAREQGTALLWVWKHVLPRLARLLPGTSTTTKSSGVLVDLLLGKLEGDRNGAYFNYSGKQIKPAHPAEEKWVAHDLLQTSDDLVKRFMFVPH